MSRISRTINRLYGKFGSGGAPKSPTGKDAVPAASRETIDQPIANAKTHCDFCQKPATLGYSTFNTISKDGKVLLCSNCAKKAAIRSNLYDTLNMDWSGAEPAMLRLAMHRAVLGQPGSLRLKHVAVEVALSLAAHSTSVNAAQQNQAPCPLPAMLQVRGENKEAFFNVLKMLLEKTGIFIFATTKKEMDTGKTAGAIQYYCYNDSLMIRHAVAFVVDGSVAPTGLFSVVCADNSSDAICFDGTDDVEMS